MQGGRGCGSMTVASVPRSATSAGGLGARSTGLVDEGLPVAPPIGSSIRSLNGSSSTMFSSMCSCPPIAPPLSASSDPSSDWPPKASGRQSMCPATLSSQVVENPCCRGKAK